VLRFKKIDKRPDSHFWKKVLKWADSFPNFSYHDSNTYKLNGFAPRYLKLVALGSKTSFEGTGNSDFQRLKEFLDGNPDWVFGFFNYDLKNQIENLHSSNFDGINMFLMHFFVPEILMAETENGLEIGVHEKVDLEKLLAKIESQDTVFEDLPALNVKCRVSKDRYLDIVNKIKGHIQYGDVYELNYCIEHYAENAQINPLEIYDRLNKLSPSPFSCLYKTLEKYLISASPERFMRKSGKTVISQPMKGTIKRGLNEKADLNLKNELFENPKERSENVMIVDLVRNDLSKSAVKGSVEVPELFGVYTFPKVHQMISTVKAELREDVHPVDLIKNAFPMGSMTGAPKVRAMELIEEYEATKRGLFSGSVGYFTPERDFDFNVIIRSILYNSEAKYLSFMTGGAITIQSEPEKEYEECLLKAQALKDALSC